jgi:hypothetical protein
MTDLAQEFQEKYHPCYKCFLNLCCTKPCPRFDSYLIILQYTIGQHFSTYDIKFQFCISKLYYLGVSDIVAKDKMLLKPIKTVRQLSSKSEMFKMIVNNLIKKFET